MSSQLGAEDLEESFMLYEQAVNHLAGSFKSRSNAAVVWAGAARRNHHSSAIRAYSILLHLLDRFLISYPTSNIESQQKFLVSRMPRSLASDAASAAIDAKELETAGELLGQGRAMLWSKLRGYRHPLDQLHQVNRQLADELGIIGVELERLALSSESGPKLDYLDSERPNWKPKCRDIAFFRKNGRR